MCRICRNDVGLADAVFCVKYHTIIFGGWQINMEDLRDFLGRYF